MTPEQIEAIHPHGLANRADCLSPDSDTSPGARWLQRVASALVEQVEGGYQVDSDFIFEAADSAVPVYTHERWLVFTDLGAWQEDLSDLGGSTGDMTEDAGRALYNIAERLLCVLVEELGDDDDDE